MTVGRTGTSGFPRAESDRGPAWEHLAHLVDPEEYDLTGDLAEVAPALDRLMEAAYLRQLREVSETDLLAALLVFRKVRDILGDQEVYLIEAARAKGVTWERLAGALELGGRQAAERRYTSLRQPMSADYSSARARIDANRDAAAEARAERHFAMANAVEVRQVAGQIAALPGVTVAAEAEAAAATERGANPRAGAAVFRPDWPARLRVELGKPGGGDPSALLDVLRSIPRPQHIELGELAVLAEEAHELRRRQHEQVLAVMRRRWVRRSGQDEDDLDEEE